LRPHLTCGKIAQVTAVVGVKTKGGVLLAADSLASNQYTKRELSLPKVCGVSELLAIAYCGSLRLGQVLTYYMEDVLDDPPMGGDEHRWAVKELIPKVRELTEEHGLLHIKNNVEHLGSSAFLLAIRGRLFDVWPDFSVEETVLPYAVDGSGADVAIGALQSAAKGRTDFTEAEALELAIKAINAAADNVPSVGGESITYVTTVLVTPEERAKSKLISSLR